jgi:hypothetical protein
MPACAAASRWTAACRGSMACSGCIPRWPKNREAVLGEEALFVHAVASPLPRSLALRWPERAGDRRHAPYELKDGWLNRLVALLPKAGRSVRHHAHVPLALRGRGERHVLCASARARRRTNCCSAWSSCTRRTRKLHALWAAAMDARGMAGTPLRQNPAELGQLAARFLAQTGGPAHRDAGDGGWDTHSAQARAWPTS